MNQSQFVTSPPEAHSSLGFRAGIRFALIGVAKVDSGRIVRPPSFEKKNVRVQEQLKFGVGRT